MKTLFEQHKGQRAIIAFTYDWKVEGKVVSVHDEYVQLETGTSGPEHFLYIQFSAIVRAHFDTGQD